MTDNTYTKEEIIQMEREILKTLKFNLSRPVSIHFLRRYSRAADAAGIHHQTAKYALELASLDYTLSSYRPSQLAAAALYLSLFLFDQNTDFSKIEKLWTPTLQFYSKYKANDLLPLVKKLAKIIGCAPTSRFKSVYNKYKSEKFDKISLSCQLNINKSSKMKKLCANEENSK